MYVLGSLACRLLQCFILKMHALPYCILVVVVCDILDLRSILVGVVFDFIMTSLHYFIYLVILY